jgi:hypothetical protein
LDIDSHSFYAFKTICCSKGRYGLKECIKIYGLVATLLRKTKSLMCRKWKSELFLFKIDELLGQRPNMFFDNFSTTKTHIYIKAILWERALVCSDHD